MGLLDFIKNRQAQQQTATPESQPETAKQMYTREAAQEKLAARPADQLRPQDAAELKSAKDLYAQGTLRVVDSPAAPSPAQPESASAPQPMAQMSMNQDKTAPAQSPTSAQQGTRANEQDAPAASEDTRAKSQERDKQTMARTRPSWER